MQNCGTPPSKAPRAEVFETSWFAYRLWVGNVIDNAIWNYIKHIALTINNMFIYRHLCRCVTGRFSWLQIPVIHGQMDPTPGFCVSQNGDVTLCFSCLWVAYVWCKWSCMSHGVLYIYIYLFIYSIYMHVVFYIWVDCQPHVFIRSKHFWMPKIGHLEAIKSAAPWKFHPLCLWTIPFWIVAYEISIKSPLKSPYYMDFHLKSYFLWK